MCIRDRGSDGRDRDSVETEAARCPANDDAELADDNSQAEANEGDGSYQGLDPVELEEFRQRTRRPREYAGLKDDVEDLYSRPTKRP